MHRQNLDVTDEIANVYPTDRFVSCSSHLFIPFVLGTLRAEDPNCEMAFFYSFPPPDAGDGDLDTASRTSGGCEIQGFNGSA